MATEPTVEPPITREEGQEEIDEGEESDQYELEGEEEDYHPEEDEEDEEGGEGVGESAQKSMTALLLGKQNGTTGSADYDEDEDEDEDEDDEYHDGGEGSAENPIDLSSVVAGSKRGVDELSEGDEYGCGVDEDDEDDGETVAKKARV